MTNTEPHGMPGTPRTVTDADRRHVVGQLDLAWSDGRLARPERDLRVTTALNTQSYRELMGLIDNLGAPIGFRIDTANANPTAETVFAVFSGTERTGAWRARKHISAFCMFGGIDLDLSRAVWEDPALEITVFCLFGGIGITIPQGVTARNDTVAIFGGSGVDQMPAAPVGAPSVHVKGFVAFGGVGVGIPKQPR